MHIKLIISNSLNSIKPIENMFKYAYYEYPTIT